MAIVSVAVFVPVGWISVPLFIAKCSSGFMVVKHLMHSAVHYSPSGTTLLDL